MNCGYRFININCLICKLFFSLFNYVVIYVLSDWVYNYLRLNIKYLFNYLVVKCGKQLLLTECLSTE